MNSPSNPPAGEQTPGHTPAEHRLYLGLTAQRVLDTLENYGPTTLSHGARYARISPAGIWVMQSTNYVLRAGSLVEWAGGNYGRWHVRISSYGQECRLRGWRDARRSQPMMDSYGPRDDVELLHVANSYYSAGQLEEIARAAIPSTRTGGDRS